MIRIRTLELNCWHDEKFEIRNISGSSGYLLLFIKTKAVFRLDGKASPVDGYITVEAKSDQATINMASNLSRSSCANAYHNGFSQKS